MAAKKSTAQKPLSDAQADANNPAIAAVEAEEIGRSRPEGMPATWPFHAVARRKRGQIKLAVSDLTERLRELQQAMSALREALPENATDASLTPAQRREGVRLAAEMDELAADAVDTMAKTAQDEPTFLEWGESLETQEVFDAFAWTVRQINEGEAGGSQTS